MDLAKINADRYQVLRKTDSVSQQEADTQSSGYQQAMANLAAADANVKRLAGARRIQACVRPFRRRDHQAQRRSRRADQRRHQEHRARNCSTSPATDPLRVYVTVPQAYAPAIHDGMKRS